MKATTMLKAWEVAHTMIDNLQYDIERTERGSGKTWSKSETNATVIDLGDRLEVNKEDGETINIWIEAETKIESNETKNNNYQIEIQRSNVTPAQFIAYIRLQCKKKGIDFYMTLDDFANVPEDRAYMSSYDVINGIKKCHFAKYATHTEYRRKTASAIFGEFKRYFYRDEFEEYKETKIHRWDSDWDATDAPCKAETCKTFPYDHQTYILNWDGSCYNEIIEFTFDDEKTGHGYYYQVNKDA